MPRRPALPKDPSQRAKAILEQAVSADQGQSSAEAQPMASLGRLGGLKGGRARAAKLSAEKRSAIAKKAATARWRKHDD